MTKAYGERLILDDFSATIPPGSIVGIVGPNGAGKTTLLKMIVGQEQPDSGSIKIGETVKWPTPTSPARSTPRKPSTKRSRRAQKRCELGDRKINARAYCSSFNFAGSDQQKKVGVLSGGERNRVHLAKTLTEGANVILLDEPTNDLDVNTLRALEEALENFAGMRRRRQP